MSVLRFLETFLDRFSEPTSMEYYSLFKQLAAYHSNGNLHDGIDSLIERSANKQLAKALADIRDSMNNGDTLGEAFLKQPLFPSFCGNIIMVGEESGKLDEILPLLAQRFKQEGEIKRKISNALLPLGFIAACLLISLFVITTFVIPKFQVVYAENKMELPILTTIVFSVTNFIFAYWYLLLILGIAGYAFLKRFGRKNPELVDRLLLKVPFYKSIYYFQIQHRFFNTMGLLRIAGTTSLNALSYAADVVDNLVVSKVLLSAADRMQHEGKNLTESLEESDNNNLLDHMGLSFMATGERNGSTSDLLQEGSAYYEDMIANAIEQFSVKIGPVFLTPAGLIMILVLAAVYWPMVKQVQYASGQ